jgi:hypothetical protein
MWAVQGTVEVVRSVRHTGRGCDEKTQALPVGAVTPLQLDPCNPRTNRPDGHQATQRAAGDVPLRSRTRMATHIFGGLARISPVGVFLWALLDKTFGLGYATESKDAWIDGGSPTLGFLSFGATGPFRRPTTPSLATPGWLFMLGLLTIGVALILDGVREPRRRRRCPAAGDDVDRRPSPGE